MNRESWLAYLPSRVIYRRKYVCQSTHEWYQHRRLDEAGLKLACCLPPRRQPLGFGSVVSLYGGYGRHSLS
jgi:hypothetical protein